MRFKFNKKIEFFLKKNFLPQSYLFEKRIKRSIKNNDEKELQLLKKIINPSQIYLKQQLVLQDQIYFLKLVNKNMKL